MNYLFGVDGGGSGCRVVLTSNDGYAILGLAGSNLGNYASKLSNDLPFAKNKILNDGEITLEGAIGPVDGCIGALGTGSVFVGRKKGITKLTGGWGFNLGDDGSGAKLGKELMKLSIKCHDGLENHSDLTIDFLCTSNFFSNVWTRQQCEEINRI